MNLLRNRGGVVAPLVILALLVGYGMQSDVTAQRSRSGPPATPDAALAELKSGNSRYVDSRRTLSVDTRHDAEDRHRLAQGQHPFATVLACSDSRVCPEIIFDQPLGSIFEVRNAGNLVDEDVLASLEYAVEHLHVPLVVVLGHSGCGAIAAVHEADGQPLHDHLSAIQQHMQGLREEIQRTRGDHSPECLDGLARENARQQAELLLTVSQPVHAAVQSGKARLVYGMYDLETGTVKFLPLEAPQPARSPGGD